MDKNTIRISGFNIGILAFNTVIVGTGAAGYNAADRLHSFGQPDVAIITESISAGTSRNTGSDKQTYYKLSLSGSDRDSVMHMTKTLFDGQCMDGDLALAEAAMSARCFFRLVELGVPFPTNRYGEYAGYKTDHDPARRATSAGPLTSRLMTEALERSVNSKSIPVFDGFQVISVLTESGNVSGVLCLNANSLDMPDERFVVFNCKNLIWAAGGPAGMYADSAYPHGHYGSSGIAFEAGVRGRNLTEWQYGLASINPRWNVSGTYMQALPRFISTNADGGEPREFLSDYFGDKSDMLTKIFLKGYEWPFDVRKSVTGSSVIDILVYIEAKHKNRRVFLDYTTNPGGGDIDFTDLGSAAREYLYRAGAAHGSPIQRLRHMNAPAYEFYRGKGIDLKKAPLEIALCAQHNNGGLAVDLWWRTNIEGFFAAGEAAGSHGVYRPGGSALNSGQAGSARAAAYISQKRSGAPQSLCCQSVEKIMNIISLSENASGMSSVEALWTRAQMEMSRVGGAIRDKQEIAKYLRELDPMLSSFPKAAGISSSRDLPMFYRLYDMLISQKTYLSAMIDYIDNGGKSRGSSLYLDPSDPIRIGGLPVSITFGLDDGSRANMLQETAYSGGNCISEWRSTHPIPDEDCFFENTWRDFRENGNVY